MDKTSIRQQLISLARKLFFTTDVNEQQEAAKQIKLLKQQLSAKTTFKGYYSAYLALPIDQRINYKSHIPGKRKKKMWIAIIQILTQVQCVPDTMQKSAEQPNFKPF